MNKKSGHWTNTGMAKFINDNLYNYKSDDEKSMNPFRWYRLQNGDDVSKYREAINGFPCRLILVNDGETPLNTGQNEPTPGNTKDMGIFNFNNDKDNVTTLGFDSDIFPNCASYEVTANSDTSAGAFMSYKAKEYNVGWIGGDFTTLIPVNVFNSRELTFDDVLSGTLYEYDIDGEIIKWCVVYKDSTVTLNEDTVKIRFSIELLHHNTYGVVSGIKFNITLGDFEELNADTPSHYEPVVNEADELAYIKESFELRHPDADDVAEDWGFMGVGEEGTGLKALIDWVDNCTDEEFVADFEEHFHKDYTLRYFCLVTLIGAVDNLGGQYSCRV